MANDLVRSPLQDLAEAIGTLRYLRTAHRLHPQLDTMINWLEAEFTYVLDPTSRLIQVEKGRRVKPR